MILEGLVNQDGEGNTIPGVAESWETTDNKHSLSTYAKTQNGLTAIRWPAEDVYSRQREDLPMFSCICREEGNYDKLHGGNAKDIVAGQERQEELALGPDANTLVIELENSGAILRNDDGPQQAAYST
ncbi:hypothetical protein O9993_14060 [Vibrio lentus]|nr:hypothetical protein [Vibrio lentus]